MFSKNMPSLETIKYTQVVNQVDKWLLTNPSLIIVKVNQHKIVIVLEILFVQDSFFCNSTNPQKKKIIIYSE